MADLAESSAPARRRLDIHEIALIALGASTTLALLLAGSAGHFLFFETISVTALFAGLAWGLRGFPGRFARPAAVLAVYGYVLWFYLAISRLTPALGTSLRDSGLLRMDEAIFGQTPAIFCGRLSSAWLTGVMTVCYLAYFPYLIGAVLYEAFRRERDSERLSPYLFTAFAFGLGGYLLVPAVGPTAAYPGLFPKPLPGGAVTRALTSLIAKGSSGYDVFPSLHILITCVLLDYDWRQVRWRFWLMILPAVALMFSTLYLRYHYAVDLLAGMVLFLALRQAFLPARKSRIISSP